MGRAVAFLLTLLLATPAWGWPPTVMVGFGAGGSFNMGKESGGTLGTINDLAPNGKLFSASGSGTLETGYILHNSTNLDRTKICVYLDDGDSLPDTGDTLVGCSASIESTAVEEVSGAFSGGSISQGSSYWIVIAPDTTDWAGAYDAGGSKICNEEYYSSPPATMQGTWSDLARDYAVWVSVTQ